MAANWYVRNKEFTNSDIIFSIKDRIPKRIRDELDDHPEDYCSLAYEYWWDLLSTIEGKYERKRAAVNLKKIASARAASLLDRDESVIIQRRKKDNTGVLIYNKSPRSAHDRHHGAQSYCVLFKNEGMPEHKYASHGSEDCTDVCTKRSIKYGMGGPIESRTHDLQQHKKSENKCNK